MKLFFSFNFPFLEKLSDFRKLFCIINVRAPRFYKIAASAILMGIARYQLDMVVVVFTVAHRAHIDTLTAVDLTEYYHKAFSKSYDFLIYSVGSLAHIVIVLDT